MSRHCRVPLLPSLLLAAACSGEPIAPGNAAPTPPLALLAPGGTVVVSPTSPNGWAFVEEVATGTGAFVAGPGTAPLGVGSARFTLDPTGRMLLGTLAYAGVRLDAFTRIAFDTYRESVDAGNLLAVTLQLDVDYDLTDAGTAWQGRLVFEPYFTAGSGNIPGGTWQHWEALAGKWWASGAPGNASCPQAAPCTWAQVLAAFPDAGLRAGVGVLQFKAGGPWPGFTGSADALVVDAEGTATTWDFEPALGGCSVAANPATETLTLLADCVTDETLLVPDGWTLDGDGYAITAVDPAGGHFKGAVVRNAGAVAHVRDLGVTVSGLADACDAGDDRLRGILFEGAAGSITGNTVTGIRQGATSGCQEGNAIEARNAPFDASGSDVAVTIADNLVSGYQKTGIVANGSVVATIRDNQVTGDGPVTYIAQNGIQVGFGGRAVVEGNSVTGNDYPPASWVACGILLFEADGVKTRRNAADGNERDFCNYGRGGGNVAPEE